MERLKGAHHRWPEKQQHIDHEPTIGVSFATGLNTLLIQLMQIALDWRNQIAMTKPAKEAKQEAWWFWR